MGTKTSDIVDSYSGTTLTGPDSTGAVYTIDAKAASRAIVIYLADAVAKANQTQACGFANWQAGVPYTLTASCTIPTDGKGSAITIGPSSAADEFGGNIIIDGSLMKLLGSPDIYQRIK